MDRAFSVVSPEEIARVRAESAPQGFVSEKIPYTAEWFVRLIADLDALTDGLFSRRLQAVRKAQAGGAKFYSKGPLAWAVSTVSAALPFDANKFDRTLAGALSIIDSFRHVRTRWCQHRDFGSLARDLCGHSFFHTMHQLYAAGLLWDAALQVAIKRATTDASADLYIRINAYETVVLEVKTRVEFEWPNDVKSRDAMRGAILRAMKSARDKRQITTEKPGVLVIGAFCTGPDFFSTLRTVLVETLAGDEGVRYHNFAAVMIQAPAGVELRRIAEGYQVGAMMQSDTILNPNFSNALFPENPIQLGPQPSPVKAP